MRARGAIALGLSVLLVAVALQVGTSPSGAVSTFTETVGGDAHTWTNYTNAGGTQGPTISAFSSVQITCAVTGFRVADGNTWWYQVASSPWNNVYYVSADAFYNNGQTSGSLHGTPFVDPAVPSCASIAGGVSETTGGAAQTWTNYANAGGTQGPTIAGFTTVQIECAVTGFRVADGNTWWYRIASSPWSHAYYVSADAFYNNGQTSGSLHGTPFVDPAVPQCGGGSGGAGRSEVAGGAANTWTNYTNAGGTQGSTIASHQTVQISCKLTGFRVANGNTWWYQIGSSPWNNSFYVSADAFYNNGASSGSLVGTPFVDSAVPDCAVAGQPRPSGETTGGAADTFGNYSHAGVPGPKIPIFTTVQVACRVTGFRVADGNTWWYLVASSPWNSVYYVSADAFYNNGRTSGSLIGTPFVDIAVPICVNNPEAPIYFSAYGSSSSSSHASAHPTTCLCGDPVNTASGDFYEAATDVSIPGRGPAIKMVRTYNDLDVSRAGLFGNGWTSTYDQHLTLNSVDGSVMATLEDGSQMIAEPDGSGGLVLPPSANSQLVHKSDGSYTLTQRQTHFLDFSSTGQLTALRDTNGYTTTLGYSGPNLSAVTDQAGRVLQVNVGSNGRITSIKDPLGRLTSYVYDGNGNLTSVTNPLGRITGYAYDSNKYMTTVTDPRGGVLTNSYDDQGRVTRQVDPAGRTTGFSYTGDNYSSAGGTTSITDPRGAVEVLQYINGFLTTDTKASGTTAQAVWTYNYDTSTYGVTSSVDPNGHTTTRSYDATGHLLTSTDPLGRTTTNTYNALGEVLTTTTPRNETTSNTYDANGNLLSTSTALIGSTPAVSRTTTYSHGDAAHPGDVSALTDPNGHINRYTYDSSSNPNRITDPLGNVTTYTYDSVGRRLTMTSPRGNASGSQPAVFTTTYSYDAADEVLSTTDPLHHAATNTYDANGNLASTTDPSGHKTTYTYDRDNERTVTTRSDATTLTNTYDANGNVVGQTDGAGHATQSTFDALNRQITSTTSDARTTSYAYDPAGNRTSLTDPASRTTAYTYDPANQLTATSYSDGVTPNVSYGYDADGHRTTMTDGSGSTSYSYDSLGRLTESTNGAGAHVGYQYDLTGNTTALSYPNGHAVTKQYDAASRMTGITDWLGHTTTFAYDADSNRTQQNYPNSIVASSGYDVAGNLISIHNHIGYFPVVSYNYERNANNQVTSEGTAGYGSASVTRSYNYNTLNQVAGDGSSAFSYDAADNLTRYGTLQLHYGNADQLKSANIGYFPFTYTNDTQGNRTSSQTVFGTTNYGYDQANRLTSTTNPSLNASYRYNGDGLRINKTVDGTTEAFSWDTSGQVPTMLTDGATDYIYGPDGAPLEQINGSAVLYFHHDQLGSTRLLTTATAGTAATYDYDAYGRTTKTTGTASNPLRYAGQYTDAETGFVYLRARYYDPYTGGFLIVDPAAMLTRAPYDYANNDPINEVDPSGLFGLSSITSHWRGIGQIVSGVGIGVLGLACGATIVCGVLAGAGAAIWSYDFAGGAHTYGGLLTNLAVGAVFGGIGAYLEYGGKFALGVFQSLTLGESGHAGDPQYHLSSGTSSSTGGRSC
jgi:RHS repeat-associated protein